MQHATLTSRMPTSGFPPDLMATLFAPPTAFDLDVEARQGILALDEAGARAAISELKSCQCGGTCPVAFTMTTLLAARIAMIQAEASGDTEAAYIARLAIEDPRFFAQFEAAMADVLYAAQVTATSRMTWLSTTAMLAVLATLQQYAVNFLGGGRVVEPVRQQQTAWNHPVHRRTGLGKRMTQRAVAYGLYMIARLTPVKARRNSFAA